jgi:hypothetical protein
MNLPAILDETHPIADIGIQIANIFDVVHSGFERVHNSQSS